MSAGTRIVGYFEGVRAALAAATAEGQPLFRDVRVHLDPFDLDAIFAETFQTPAARVIFGQGKPDANADGGFDLVVTGIVAVIAKRSGRPDPAIASADAGALSLALDVASLIAVDPYFGLGRVTAAQVGGIKVALPEKSTKEGMAVVLVEFESRLLRLVAPWPQADALFTPTAPPRTATVTVDGAPFLPEPGP